MIRHRGFKGTTTRAIAEEAGVNEVTIFRHFQNKKGIIKAAFEKTSYAAAFSSVLKKKVKWNLEADLIMLSKEYQYLLHENSELIVISIKEADHFPELEEEVVNVPSQIKNDLIGYLAEMKARKKVIDTNLEAQALLFIWLNFSYFTNTIRSKKNITDLSEDEYLTNVIHVFARGLTP